MRTTRNGAAAALLVAMAAVAPAWASDAASSSAAGPAPVCPSGEPSPTITDARHPNDGVADPRGRIVFGRLTRDDEIFGQIVSLAAIDPDGSDLVLLLDCDVVRPRFSPDGTRLAFGIAMDDGTMQIATSAVDGSDLRILTSTEGYADTPDWSPDGSWLVYAHSPAPCSSPWWHVCVIEEGMRQTLWRMDADGLNQTLLGDPDTFDWEPRISPDGSEVVFTRIEPTNDFWLTLMIRDLATGRERVVTSDVREPEHPEWSPDGEWIIYNTLHTEDPSVPMEQIERVPPNDPDAEPLVLWAPPGGGLGAYKPTYAPDGSGIAFGCRRALCLMDPDGGNVVELLREPDVELNHFTWGPSRKGR